MTPMKTSCAFLFVTAMAVIAAPVFAKETISEEEV